MDYILTSEGFSFQWENRVGDQVYDKESSLYPITVPRYIDLYPYVVQNILDRAGISMKRAAQLQKIFDKEK